MCLFCQSFEVDHVETVWRQMNGFMGAVLWLYRWIDTWMNRFVTLCTYALGFMGM